MVLAGRHREVFTSRGAESFIQCGEVELIARGNHRPPLTREEVMKNLALKVQRFLVSEDGPTAVEYAVMLSLIVVVCLAAIQAIGTNATSTFNSVAAKLGTS